MKRRKPNSLYFARKKRRTNNWNKPPRQRKGIAVQEAVNVTYGSVEEILNCPCPVCAEITQDGKPQIIIDENGKRHEITRDIPEMMEIHVTLSPEMSRFASQEICISVPVECSLADMLEYLRFKYSGLQREYAPMSLAGRIAGERASSTFILEPGQKVSVFGVRSAQWSQMIAPTYAMS